MEIGAIFFILALLLLVTSYVARPLIARTSTPFGRANPKLSRLQAQRERVLDSIQELEADHDMGKVLPSEYRALRQQLATQGAMVLRQIDDLGGGAEAALEAELESRVAELRLSRQVASPTPEAALEAELESRVTALKERRSGGFCPECGTEAQAGDRFCSNCGHALAG